MIGYDEGPSGIQFLVFIGSLLTMSLLYHRLQGGSGNDHRGRLRRSPA